MATICKNILWEESLFIVDLEKINNEEIIKHYYELKEEDPIGVSNSNDGGWQKMLSPGRCEELDKVLRDIEGAATEIYNKQYKRKETLVISNCWFNGNNYGDNNMLHTHPGSVLSGVYYLTDGEIEHGTIHFQRSNADLIHSFRHPKEEGEALASCESPLDIGVDYTRSARFEAKASRALIFGPWMEHGVTANRTHDTRIVIGLNFTILGKEHHSPFDYFDAKEDHYDDN